MTALVTVCVWCPWQVEDVQAQVAWLSGSPALYGGRFLNRASFNSVTSTSQSCALLCQFLYQVCSCWYHEDAALYWFTRRCIDDESHALGSCVAANALRMDPRFSALPFTDIRDLMSRGDSRTVALFVHRCLCVVDDDLQAQRA
jgi:hypothetical protein